MNLTNFFYQGVMKRILFPRVGQTIVYYATSEKIVYFAIGEKKSYFASVKFDARAKRR